MPGEGRQAAKGKARRSKTADAEAKAE